MGIQDAAGFEVGLSSLRAIAKVKSAWDVHAQVSSLLRHDSLDDVTAAMSHHESLVREFSRPPEQQRIIHSSAANIKMFRNDCGRLTRVNWSSCQKVAFRCLLDLRNIG